MADKAASQRESWWVLQAQSGSHEALNELFRSVQGPLFRYVVSLVKDQHLAEDILQEVFIRIYRKLRWLREPQAFRGPRPRSAGSVYQSWHCACVESCRVA